MKLNDVRNNQHQGMDLQGDTLVFLLFYWYIFYVALVTNNKFSRVLSSFCDFFGLHRFISVSGVE